MECGGKEERKPMPNKKEVVVYYICDRLKCRDKYNGVCPDSEHGNYCRLTSDVSHAEYFSIDEVDEKRIVYVQD